MVVAAMNFIGVRYRRGGNSAETGFDCSGFTRHVFEMSLGPGAAAPRRRAGGGAGPGADQARRSAARRPGVLQHLAAHLLACRHLHRRQPLHPLAAHRRATCAPRTWASPTGPSASPARAAPSRRCDQAGAGPRRDGDAGARTADRAARRTLARCRAAGSGERRGTIAAWPKESFPSPTTATLATPAARCPRRLAAPTGLSPTALRPAAARPAHLGHRPLQLPLQLLHAEGGVRQALQLPAARRRC